MSAEVSRPADPYVGFRFSIEVGPEKKDKGGQDDQYRRPALDGPTTAAGFHEVSGLDFEIDVETLRVGGINDGEVILPGPGKFPSRLVLKRGLASGSILYPWYRQVMAG